MNTLTPPVSSKDHSAGKPDAPITLVEYGDFECPDCGNAHPVVKEWQDQFGDTLRFIFRQMPLDQVYPIHPHATRAALASEAAGRQDKFWEMHDLLFQNQEYLGDEDLTGYAELLGLDLGKFEKDMQDPELATAITASVKAGTAAGVTSTPGFFLNGKRVEEPRDYETLGKMLEELAA